MHPLQYIWLWFGIKILKWEHIDIYSPDRKNIVAITFSMDKEYINKVQDIEKK